jgi:hypothetical protein
MSASAVFSQFTHSLNILALHGLAIRFGARHVVLCVLPSTLTLGCRLSSRVTSPSSKSIGPSRSGALGRNVNNAHVTTLLSPGSLEQKRQGKSQEDWSCVARNL